MEKIQLILNYFLLFIGIFIIFINRDEYSFNVKKRHYLTKKINNFPELSMLEIAKKLNFAPFEIAYNILTKKYSKELANEYLIHPNKIENDSIRKQVIECLENDHQSPYRNIISNEIGKHGEYILEQKLKRRNIPFLSENQLRKMSYTKTPDIYFIIPIIIKDPNTNKDCVINWIDSKYQFGSPHNNKNNLEQFTSYINLFGPGAVIYWLDYVENDDILDGLIKLTSFPNDIKILDI